MYEYGGGVVAVTNIRYEAGRLKALGWTETPLYTHPTPPAADEGLMRELDDFLVDLVGDLDDAENAGAAVFMSAIGSKWTKRVRALAERVAAIQEAGRG